MVAQTSRCVRKTISPEKGLWERAGFEVRGIVYTAAPGEGAEGRGGRCGGRAAREEGGGRGGSTWFANDVHGGS